MRIAIVATLISAGIWYAQQIDTAKVFPVVTQPEMVKAKVHKKTVQIPDLVIPGWLVGPPPCAAQPRENMCVEI